MHDLKANFDKFLILAQEGLSGLLDTVGNLQQYRHKPKLPDCHVIALSLCMESMGIDTRNMQ